MFIRILANKRLLPPYETFSGNTFNVSNSSELTTALGSMVAGDQVILANGDYGVGNFNQSFSGYITIRAANNKQATFDEINITGDYLRFDGVVSNSYFGLTNASYIDVRNSELGGTYADFSSNLIWRDNDIAGYCGLYNASYVEFVNNYCHPGVPHAAAMQIMDDSHHILVESNSFIDVIAPNPDSHPDLLQFLSYEIGTPHDVTVRKNHFYDNAATQAEGGVGAQGIFISDAGPTGYQNMLIEENLVACVIPNAITIRSGKVNCIIRNNTVTQGRIWISDLNGADNSGTQVYDNITPSLVDDGAGSTVTHNLVANPEDALLDYTDGATVEEFRPTATTLSNGYGALTWW